MNDAGESRPQFQPDSSGVAAPYGFTNGSLSWCGAVLLNRLPSQVTASVDAAGTGVFLRWNHLPLASRHLLECGCLGAHTQFCGCARTEPAWMEAFTGTRSWDIPYETYFLIGTLGAGGYFVLVSLVDGPYPCSIRGNDLDRLEIYADSGEDGACLPQVTGLYVAAGYDPYLLIQAAAKQVAGSCGTVRLRRDKKVPAFAELFGWCTWDAFYTEVSQEGVLSGLASLAAAGRAPAFLVLDDGWQSVRPCGENTPSVLTAWEANEKFPGGLAGLSWASKQTYGLRYLLVWQALFGYWGGAEAHEFPQYRFARTEGRFSDSIRAARRFNPRQACAREIVHPDDAYRFFHDNAAYLRSCGVDGLKLDGQGYLEAYTADHGGRVSVSRKMREAVEGAVHVHLEGNVIHCMAHPAELIYHSASTVLYRSSPDYYPDKAESHGKHIFNNALFSLWFGEFVHPDWDMFQTQHEAANLHAVARALSGGPVYVSDKPGHHDAALLAKLVLPSGEVLRPADPALPTRDCLFVNPTTDPVLYKIFNRNLRSGVIGIFHCQQGAGEASSTNLQAVFSPQDVEGLEGERLAVYCHHTTELLEMVLEEQREISLAPRQAEVVTVVPIENGFAPIGLPDMFNSAGVVTSKEFDIHGVCVVHLRWGGRFLAWSDRRPSCVLLDGHRIHFTFDEQFHGLEILIHGLGPRELRVYWDAV